jgi:hypothetical protein
VFHQPAEGRLGRDVPLADLLIRQVGQLALQDVPVQIQEDLQHLPLVAGADQLIGGKRRSGSG